MSKTLLDIINPVGSGNEVYVLQLSIHLPGKTCKQECPAVKLVPLLCPVSAGIAREQYEWADHYWSTSCFLLQWVWCTVSQRFPHVNVFVRYHVQLALWKAVATLPLHPCMASTISDASIVTLTNESGWNPANEFMSGTGMDTASERM